MFLDIILIFAATCGFTLSFAWLIGGRLTERGRVRGYKIAICIGVFAASLAVKSYSRWRTDSLKEQVAAYANPAADLAAEAADAAAGETAANLVAEAAGATASEAAARAIEVDEDKAAAELEERYADLEMRRELFAAQSEERARKSEALQSFVKLRREEAEQRRQESQLESINCNIAQTREAIEDHIDAIENRPRSYKPVRYKPVGDFGIGC